MGRAFSALVVTQKPDGAFSRRVTRRDTDELPPGDILVRVMYSSLNYKDALAATGRRGVARGYPLTPGIDAAGIVEESSAKSFSEGDSVIVGGHDFGTAVPGGFGQYISVPASWALKIPAGLTPREAMILGTAGFTAAFCIQTLRDNGVVPGHGEVLVTGATGGVGSLAVAMLARLGHAVSACTGKEDQDDYLRSLGAREIVRRNAFDDSSGKALLKERWSGVVDTVGGGILSTAVRSTLYGGAVTACGNAASPELPLTVFPFILRGVRLIGIESSRCSIDVRKELWDRLAGPWKPDQLEALAHECSLEDASGRIDSMLRGQVTGRVIVNLREPG